MALAATASAQGVWQEQGDAGYLPGNAQAVAGNYQDPLTRITGRISANDIADLYVILICDPASFYAHTGATTETTFDSKLTLYDSQGRPLWFNDDRPSEVANTPPGGVGSFRSYIGGGAAPGSYRSSNLPNTPASAQWSLPGPGIYYLAVSFWEAVSRNANGQDLFYEGSPFFSIYAPFAARANDVLGQWGGSSTAGTYTTCAACALCPSQSA